MEWIKKNRFLLLLIIEVCLGIFWCWFFGFLAFLFIWLNYMCTSNMKKMLILDVALLAATQAGMWHEYYDWLRTTEVIDVGASLMQLGYILFFLAHGFFITAMMCWSYFRKDNKVAASITGSIALIGVLFFGFLAVVLGV